MITTTLPSSAAHETGPVVAAVIVMGVAALLMMGIQPMLLGGLVEAGRLTETSMGYAAAIELFGVAVGAAIGPFVVNKHMRAKAVAISLALAFANVSIYVADAPVKILTERGVAGVLEGLLLGAASLIAVHNSRPERMNGLLIGLATAPQVAAAYALPIFILPRYGLNAGFILLGAASLLSAFASCVIVDRVEAPQVASHDRVHWSPALIAVVATVFLQNAGSSAAWSYTEQLAHQHHFTGAVVGAATAGSLILQVAGALLAAWFGRRLPTLPSLIAGAFLQAAIILAIGFAQSPGLYALLLCVFGVFWLAQQPIQVAEIVALDPSRRVAAFVPAVALVGISAGPFAVSFVVSPTIVERAFWGGAVMVAVGGVFLAAVTLRAGGLRSAPANARSF